jgi:cytochrome c oxidase subunit 3
MKSKWRATVSETHEPYHQASQQREAGILGAFVFLATEIMLFGGLFAVSFTMRFLHPVEMVEASRKLHYGIGALNTAILLSSSFLVALAVQAARDASKRATYLCLTGAMMLGTAFLAVKAYEYRLEFTEGILPSLSGPAHSAGPVDRLFMNLYLISTALHALHVSIGVALLSIMAWRVKRNAMALPERAITVEVVGLYWHLVDVIWLFLYPTLYLVR